MQTVWPSIADIHQEYLAAVERVRPIFVALGCAEALRKAGRWHLPSLEEWASIEKAIKLQAALNEVRVHVYMDRCVYVQVRLYNMNSLIHA